MTSNRMIGELSEPNNLSYLEWKIPNFCYWYTYSYPQRFLTSPTFIFENNSWHISLCPYDGLSVFLINETQRPRNVNYSFSIKTPKGTLLAYCANNATIYNKSGFIGFYNARFLEDEDLCLPETDTLTIVCILTPGENGEQLFNYTAPKTDRMTSNSMIGELNTLKNLRQFEWKIPNFSHWCNCPYPQRCLISPTFVFENTSWHISLRPHGDGSLFLINETQRPCNINFSFSIKESKGTLLAYRTNNTIIENKCSFINVSQLLEDAGFSEKHCLFPSDTLTIVCILKPAENWKQALNYTAPKADNYNLKSEVESLNLTETDVLSKNLKDLFTNKDNYDTVLRVTDREFYVHKTILMARSSVFAAMFQHDTPKKRTGIINIANCDSNTFEQFLEYLYSGKLEGVSFDSAFQLYSTSDKYNVQELKVFCTQCMMQNLTVQNISDVVILADKYDEAMLYSAAQEFFNGNFKKILKTSEWENFLKMNHRLANKLLIAMSESKE